MKVKIAGMYWSLLMALTMCHSAGAAEYEFELIRIPGVPHTHAVGINNRGEVLLSGLPEQQAYLRDRKGSFIPIRGPLDENLVGLGINNRGAIVGDVWDANVQEYVGFIRERAGDFLTYRVPDSAGQQANDINDRGVVVGAASTGAYIRHPDGRFEFFNYHGNPATYAYGINNGGEISVQVQQSLRTESYLRRANGSFILINIPGSTDTQAFGINNRGVVTGLVATNGVHAFVWDRQGRYTLIDVPGAETTFAWGINDRGQLAGIATFDGGIQVGFVATPRHVKKPH